MTEEDVVQFVLSNYDLKYSLIQLLKRYFLSIKNYGNH